MNLLNKLTNKDSIKKGEELKKRLKECIKHVDEDTSTVDSIDVYDYMDLLIKYKSNPEAYDTDGYNMEMAAIDKALSSINKSETDTRLSDTVGGCR